MKTLLWTAVVALAFASCTQASKKSAPAAEASAPLAAPAPSIDAGVGPVEPVVDAGAAPAEELIADAGVAGAVDGGLAEAAAPPEAAPAQKN